MALDPYQPCPCGSGKKLKFCCCADIVVELERVLQMVQSEQRMAAADQVDRLLEKYPDRAALLVTKANVQMQMRQLDEAEQTVATLLRLDPTNPTVLAQSAMLTAAKGGALPAIEILQRAMTAIDRQMPVAVYDAIGVMAQALLADGYLLAARGHLLLQVGIGGTDDPAAMQMLVQMNSSQEIPLLLKQDAALVECPADVPWRDQFNQAIELANRGAWAAAVDTLRLVAETAEHPAIDRNLSILLGWLGDVPGTVVALRKYAASADVPLDDAVEAEATAQLLDPDTYKETVDLVQSDYPVTDAERLLENFASQRRLSRMPIDPMMLTGDDTPPPRGIYWLLDKPMPASGQDLQVDDVPSVLGEVYLYGKQTDRDAYVRFVATRNEHYDGAVTALAEIGGELIGALTHEETVGQRPATIDAMSSNWRMPDDATPEVRAALVEQQRRSMMFQRWPALKLAALDGKTPTEAAADPAYRVRLLATILLLQQQGAQNDATLDFNELRSQLELPTVEPIDPTGVDVRTIPLIRLARLSVDKLTDDDLVQAYQRSAVMGAVEALVPLARAVISRASFDEQPDKIDKASAYVMLARATTNATESAALFEQARNVIVARGQSPAALLLEELSTGLQRRDQATCQRVLGQLQARHMNEPGVQQALMQLLSQHGVVPQGAAQGPPMPSGAMPPAAPAAGPSDGIWTPEGGAPPAAAPPAEDGGKSKLWVPGMD